MKNKLIAFYIALVFIMGAFAFVPPPASALGGWTYSRTITIDDALVARSLTNFPVLVVLNASIGAKCDNGKSIRFQDSTGNDMYYEIEGFNAAGNSYVWTKVPYVKKSGLGDTTFTLYYNNSAATDAQSKTNVWDSSYQFVWHLNQSNGTFVDSTSNYRNGLVGGATTPSYTASGLAAGAYTYDRKVESIYSKANMIVMSTYTMSAFVKFTNASAGTGDNVIVIPTNDPCVYRGSADKIYTYADGSSQHTSTTTYDNTNWHMVSIVSTNARFILFVDGLEEGNSSLTTANQAVKFYLGDNSLGSDSFTGTIDEARVSNVERNITWHKTTYYTVMQTSGFMTIGPESTALIQTNPQPSNGQTGITTDPYLNITISDSTGKLMNVTKCTNASGIWQTIFHLYNSGNATISNLSSGIFTAYSKKYWWSVNLTNTVKSWSNMTYSFTTHAIATTVTPISGYNFTTNLLLNVSGYSDLSNVTLYYRYKSLLNFTKYTSSMALDDSFVDGIDSVWMEYPNSMKIVGDYAYVISSNNDALVIVDMMNTSALTQKTAKQDAIYLDTAHDIWVTSDGDYAYTLCYSTSPGPHLVMWNVTNKAIAPVRVKWYNLSYDTGMYAYLQNDNYLYVNCMTHTWIFNVTSKSTFQLTNMSWFNTGCVALSHVRWHVYALEDTLYVFVSNSSAAVGGDGVYIYNVSNKASPSFVKRINNTQTIREFKEYWWHGFHYLIGGVYSKPGTYWKGQIGIWNVSNGDYDNPVFLLTKTTMQVDGNYSADVEAIIGNYVYLMQRNNNISMYVGIACYNLTDINNPTFVSKFGSIGSPNYMNICHDIEADQNGSLENVFVLSQIDNSFVALKTNQVNESDGWLSFNKDTSSPWAWTFTFPNGTGYYQFYLRGQKIGSTAEAMPSNTPDEYVHYFLLPNHLPVTSNPGPTNGSLDVAFNPRLNITVNDTDIDALDVYFRSNASGSWATIGSNLTVYNGTYRQTSNNATGYSATYWWSVNVSDGTGWSNYSFYFTTISNLVPAVSNEYPSNGSINVSVTLPGIHAYFSDPNGDPMTWQITIRNVSVWGFPIWNSTRYSNTSFKFVYSHLYYWWANVTDSYNSTNRTFHFTTEANTPPVISSPYPSNNSNVVATLASTHVTIRDLDTFNYTIELSNGQNASGNGMSNGTKTLSVSGLIGGTTYSWWVNSSDGMDFSSTKYYFTITNSTTTLRGNITVSFEINQFSIIILLILMIFFTIIGYTINNAKTGAAFLMFAGIFTILSMISVVAYFSGIWYLSTPGFVVVALIFFKDTLLMIMYGDKWRDRGKK